MPDNIFSAIAQGLYKPKLNAVGVDANGNYVDASGNPTSLYSQPGFMQKALNPQAQEIQQLNLQASAYPQEQMQQANVRRTIGEKMYGLTDEDYQHWGDRPVPQSERTEEQAQEQFANQGGAGLLSAGLHNTASAQAEEAANRTREASQRGLLGNPELSAGTENLGLQYQSGEYGGEMGLQPQKFHTRGLQLGNEAIQAGQQREQLPYLGRSGLAQAELGAGLSEAELAGEPFKAQTIRANDITGAYQATHPQGLGMAPTMGSVNVGRGTINPAAYNPSFIPPEMYPALYMQHGGLNQLTGQGSQMLTAPSGARYAVPAKQTNPEQAVLQRGSGEFTQSDFGRSGLSPEYQSRDDLGLPDISTNAPATVNQATNAPSRRIIGGLGSTLGGQDIDTTPVHTTPPATKGEALASLGLHLDSNGQLQRGTGWKYRKYGTGMEQITPQTLEQARRILQSNLPD